MCRVYPLMNHGMDIELNLDRRNPTDLVCVGRFSAQ